MPLPQKSVAKHIENGTYRPSVHGPKVRALLAAQPVTKPRGLKPNVSRVWDEFAQLLADRLRPEDVPILTLAATWYATWQTSAKTLAKKECGTLPYTRTLTTLSVASQRFEACVKRLGMSPADRELMTLMNPLENAPKALVKDKEPV